MWVYVDWVNTQSNPSPGANAFGPRGQTFDMPLAGPGGSSWLYWHTGFSTQWDGPSNGISMRYHGYSDVRSRWRASKGSAPVNRFTRAFGNNNTEGWHRTMPVATSTTVTVAVPAVFLRLLALQPTTTPGQAVLPAPPTTIKLVAVAPSVSQTTQVAVPASRVTLAAVAPSRTTTRTLAVPVTAVRFLAVAPATSPGASTVQVPPSVTRLLVRVPTVVAYIPVQVARVTLLAVAPSVTGGGGGGVKVIPRSSGEGHGSMTT